jgi:hypothetical protein
VTTGLGASSAFKDAMKGMQLSASAQTAFTAAAGNALTQGIAVITDLQDSFSWRNVALSAVAAPMAASVNQGIAALTGSNFFGHFAGGIAGSLVRRAFGGKVDPTSALVDAFGNALGNTIVEEIASSASAVADRITDRIKEQVGDTLSPEDRAKLARFERSAAESIRRARQETDAGAADRMMSDILDEALGFYPDKEVDDALALLRRPPEDSSEGEVVVSAREEFGLGAFGLADRPAVYAGRLKSRVEGEIQAWTERTPGAALALSVIDWGMTIAGGPARFAAGKVVGAAQEEMEAAATQRFRDVGYTDAVSQHGGGGSIYLAELLVGSLAILKRRDPTKPDYQATKPSGRPGDIAANLSGRRSTSKVTTWVQENKVADLLAEKGYRVYQNPNLTDEQRASVGILDRNPDYLIEGKPFDLYSPLAGTNIRNMADTIAGKVDPTHRQADRVVVDIRETSVSTRELEAYVRADPVRFSGLNELKVITTDPYGKVSIETIRRTW